MKKAMACILLVFALAFIGGCASSDSRYVEVLERENEELRAKLDELQNNPDRYFDDLIKPEDVPAFVDKYLTEDYIHLDNLGEFLAEHVDEYVYVENIPNYIEEHGIITYSAQLQIDELEYQLYLLPYSIGNDLYYAGYYDASGYVFDKYAKEPPDEQEPEPTRDSGRQ